MPKWYRRSTALPRGGTPPPPTAATTLSDGPVELPISPPSPVHPPIGDASENNPLPHLSQYQYPYLGHPNNDYVDNANPEVASIEFVEHSPRGPSGWWERGRRLCRKKGVWALMALLLVLLICLAIGLGVLRQKGDKGKTGRSSLTSSGSSTAQPPAPSALVVATNSSTSDPPHGGTNTTTTPTKRVATVTSTIRTTPTPSAYTTFPLWTGTFDTISPLVSSSGTCKTSTSTTILQDCAKNARFTTTIGDFKPDGYAIGTTLWVFKNYLVPTDRSGEQWYYSGNSIEKKYPHTGSPGCEVVEKAELWLGRDGVYVLRVNYESANTCTLDSGRTKDPTAQVCECMYEGAFTTIS